MGGLESQEPEATTVIYRWAHLPPTARTDYSMHAANRELCGEKHPAERKQKKPAAAPLRGPGDYVLQRLHTEKRHPPLDPRAEALGDSPSTSQFKASSDLACSDGATGASTGFCLVLDTEN